MPSKAETFRERAETCRHHAESAVDEAGRQHWHKLADEWNKMADAEDRRNSPLQHDPHRHRTPAVSGGDSSA